MFTKMTAAACLLGVALGVSPASAAIIADLNNPNESYTIQEIIDNGGLLVGDKLFDSFRVVGIDTQTPTPLDTESISIKGVFIDGQYGIQINGGWTASSGNTSATTIGYRVSVTDPVMEISSATLKMTNPGTLGDGTAGATANHYAVDPTISNSLSLGELATGYFVGSPIEWTIATETFEEHRDFLWVVTGVVVQSQQLGSATLSEVIHTFGQSVVPEPASVALIVAGGMLMFGRRRR